MGWTSYMAKNYKSNGTIDRKAECDNYFTEYGQYEVVKSAMVGSVYYAAVRKLKNCVGFEKTEPWCENPIFENVTEDERKKVWCAVFLTKVDRYEFYYKDMSEDMHPYYYDCPIGILNLLTPTENESANAWRVACRKRIEEKKTAKKNPHALNNLPVGSRITFAAPFSSPSCGVNKGDKIILIKTKSCRFKNPVWSDGCYRWKRTLIPKDYEVMEVGA